MKNSSINNTIKHSFTTIIAICIIFVATFSFSLTLSIYQEKNKENYKETIGYIARNVSWEVSSITRIMDFIFVDHSVKLLIDDDKETEYELLKEKENIDHIINDNILNSSFTYLKEVEILKSDDIAYRYLNGMEGDLIYTQKLLDEGYFDDVEGSSVLFLTDCNDLVIDDVKDRYILCLRNIFDSKYSAPIGYMVFLFDKKVFTRQLSFSDAEGSSGLLLMDSTTGNPIFNNSDVFFEYTESNLIVSNPIELTSWTLNGYFTPHLFQKELLFVLVSILISILFSILLSRKIWGTLEKNIISPINKVSVGLDMLTKQPLDLKNLMIIDDEKTSESEVYHLIENYNLMLTQIDELIETNIKKQIDVEKAEFLALQRQINPHFLYNAIGTMRWMAILQGADNIKDYSERLVHLLRSIANAKENNTVGDEVECMQDFIAIQSLAYHYSFEVEYSFPKNWEEIKNIECVRFILQPLVENAIVHGVATKESDGYLRVSVCSKTFDFGDVIEFSIFDNGVGIQSDELSGNVMSGIGFSNVQERLIRAYGDNYGVSVDSIKGEFTECIVRIPFKKVDVN
jgi:two-component system sensor histidine kinase YesM